MKLISSKSKINSLIKKYKRKKEDTQQFSGKLLKKDIILNLNSFDKKESQVFILVTIK